MFIESQVIMHLHGLTGKRENIEMKMTLAYEYLLFTQRKDDS